MYTRIITRGIAAPSRRPLKIFAVDPMLGRTFGNRARVDIANEVVRAGPIGQRVAVIDYDGARKCFYEPVDLNNPSLLMQGGLDPSESDPRFHQQMVYAVTMKTIENFDRALGRQLKLGTRKYPRLRLFPHAFYGANAYYARKLNAVLFGYFRADRSNPGENLPGQIVYTCLSHDVIAHEVTHKIVDRLRPRFLEPSNEDVLAFHEGFSDIVALFQHFSFPDVLREQIAQSRSDIRTARPLVQLAQQFGYATGSGKSLRSALDQPDAKLYESLFEPHDRGAILVAAMFDGFNKAYQRSIQDLIRIGTGGSGVLPQGDLHPDLVNRIAREAARIAQRVLDMSIRAFDYMPPVDVNFGDFLRAMVTADYELIPEDDLNLRSAMIEAFRLRGIYPGGVASLAEESLLWEPARRAVPPLPESVMELLQPLFFSAVLDFDTQISEGDPWGDTAPTQRSDRGLRARLEQQEVRQSVPEREEGDEDDDVPLDVGKDMAVRLTAYARDICAELGLDPNLKIQTQAFHPVFRVAPNGRFVIELIAQFTQQDPSTKGALGGLPLRGGATLVVGADGQVRYIVRKSMPGAQVPENHRKLGAARLAQQQSYVAHVDARSASLPYLEERSYADRIAKMADFARLHQG